MMRVWGKLLTASCPRCNSPNEDNSHILKCLSDGAVNTWEESVMKLKEQLNKNQSCPDLDLLLSNILETWKTGEQIKLHRGVSFDGVRKVFKINKIIGWRLCIDGCLVNEWENEQQNYLEWRGSEKLDKKWVAGLIYKLW